MTEHTIKRPFQSYKDDGVCVRGWGRGRVEVKRSVCVCVGGGGGGLRTVIMKDSVHLINNI